MSETVYWILVAFLLVSNFMLSLVLMDYRLIDREHAKEDRATGWDKGYQQGWDDRDDYERDEEWSTAYVKPNPYRGKS